MDPVVIIERIQNFPINSNCYVIKNPDTVGCILVDPASGDDASLHAWLMAKALEPEYIILTHEHFDHISSVEYLRRKYNCKVIATKTCSDHIGHPKKNLSIFYDQVGFTCAPADILVKENDWRIRLADISIKFYLTPGHTEGGLCFSIGSNLFTGDTILKGYKTIVKLPGGSKKELNESIAMLFRLFPGTTTVYPGHGESFPLSDVTAFSINN